MATRAARERFRVGSVRKRDLCHARRRARLQDDGLEDRGDVRQAFCREPCARDVTASELGLDDGR